MPDVNIMEYIDETGKFGDGFAEAATAIAGESHKGSKVYDDVPDFDTLVKNYADTKSLVGKKLEGVIQKPANDASDEDKAAYRDGLLTELGASENPDDYKFPEVEGIEYHPDVAKLFQDYFVEKKSVTVSGVTTYEGINRENVTITFEFNPGVENNTATSLVTTMSSETGSYIVELSPGSYIIDAVNETGDN
ncbi:hypothetical protein KAR91_26320, partial [Candidatus Pacearchaeota archaeon]|nr:hypothetical protein [Candidatus Pacearchaeota archaeon]